MTSQFPGVQLAGVTEKLNGVTDGGRRKLTGVTDGAPAKGRRGHTFNHTERALVATFNLSDRTNQNI
jgi:hypothetical protein